MVDVIAHHVLHDGYWAVDRAVFLFWMISYKLWFVISIQRSANIDIIPGCILILYASAHTRLMIQLILQVNERA